MYCAMGSRQLAEVIISLLEVILVDNLVVLESALEVLRRRED